MPKIKKQLKIFNLDFEKYKLPGGQPQRPLLCKIMPASHCGGARAVVVGGGNGTDGFG